MAESCRETGSGRLPQSIYHRAGSLGSGSFGSVLVAYEEDSGEEYALKLFTPDEEEEDGEDEGEEEERTSGTINIGALRELSMLRLLREENGHPNVVEISDIRHYFVSGEDGDEDEHDDGYRALLGEGGSDVMGNVLVMAMPLYKEGTLTDAIEKGLLRNRRALKVHIAHGLLSAVAFLHDNGITHRDIKGDNVMLRRPLSSNGDATEHNAMPEPVLIDFSLAKFVNVNVYDESQQGRVESAFSDIEGRDVTHTPDVGTPTYRAPEVIGINEDESRDGASYSLKADLWSVGIVLLELLTDTLLPSDRDRSAWKYVRQLLDSDENLPYNQPFPALIRGLLTVDASERLSARDALSSPLFAKFGYSKPQPAGTATPTPRQLGHAIGIGSAFPENHEERMNDENLSPSTSFAKGSTQSSHRDPKIASMTKRQRVISRICEYLGCTHPLTRHAALEYSIRLEETVEPDIDDHPQAVADCVVLASRFFEVDYWNLYDLQENNASTKLFQNWSVEVYRDTESTIFQLMDFCLYPRKLYDWKR